MLNKLSAIWASNVLQSYLAVRTAIQFFFSKSPLTAPHLKLNIPVRENCCATFFPLSLSLSEYVEQISC